MVLENKEAVMNIVDLKQYIKPGKLYKEKESTFYAQAQIPTECRSNHASCLTQLDNGDILCVWFGGSAEGSGDTKIHLSRLNKGASQWTEPKRISDDYNCSEQNPFIYDFGGGHLWCPHRSENKGNVKGRMERPCKSGKAKGSYTMQETAEIRILESFDYGCTFKRESP